MSRSRLIIKERIGQWLFGIKLQKIELSLVQLELAGASVPGYSNKRKLDPLPHLKKIGNGDPVRASGLCARWRIRGAR